MALIKLDVFALRNILSANILPSNRINLITGSNASGKSSLLEAIYILGRAKSFRTTHLKQVINFEASKIIVSAQTRQSNDSITSLGIQIDNKQTEIRINQESKQKADLAYALPVQLIHPNSYRLLDAGPQYRREFLDWGIFNQNKNFLHCWRRYNKALQQRNILLKTQQVKQIPSWDRELVESGLMVNEYRKNYVTLLKSVFTEIAVFFLDILEIELCFQSGWDDKNSLFDRLKIDLEKDLRYGYTHSGPHRADFLVYSQKRLARDYLSRGQQKLLVLALLLSQVKLLDAEGYNNCCILIDDLTAELDTLNRLKLLKYLIELDCQVFMTATCLPDFGDLSLLSHYKVFHVEHGNITLV